MNHVQYSYRVNLYIEDIEQLKANPEVEKAKKERQAN